MTELTRREKEVLVGINLGMTNREIAETLFVSMETVRTHCQNIHRKIGDKWPRPKKGRQGVRSDLCSSVAYPLPANNGAEANSAPGKGKA